MIIHILHRRSAIKTDEGESLLPGEEGLMHSDEVMAVEETFDSVHYSEEAAKTEEARLNAEAVKAQQAKYHEVLDANPWTVTSMVIEKAKHTPNATGV